MSRFHALKAKFSERKNADENYWQDMERTVADIYSSFVNYLQPPAPIKDGDKETPWVDIGVIKEDKFVPCAIKDLPRQDETITFTIGLRLSEDECAKPKHFHSITVLMRHFDGDYVVSSSAGNFSNLTLKDRDFSPLHEVLLAAFEKAISEN
jgi:hypothetical protein